MDDTGVGDDENRVCAGITRRTVHSQGEDAACERPLRG